MGRRGKYGAVRVRIDGIHFDSKREGARYEQLKLLQKANVIRDLRCHPSWAIFINDTKVCHVELDFAYWDIEKNKWVHEDVKGMWTPLGKLKLKMLKAAYPELHIEILGGDMWGR